MCYRTYGKKDNSGMKKVTVVVEKANDGTYWCHTDGIGKVGLNACGNTVAEAKKDLADCLAMAKEDASENGEDFPEVEFEYKYDLQSFFNYFTFLNVSEIAKRAGINPSLMRQYSSGIKKAGEKTYERLSLCMDGIKKGLSVATF